MLLRERKSVFRRTIFRHFLIYIDVHRPASIDSVHEATIDEYWNIDGGKSLSEQWICVTRFELLNPSEGHMSV